MQEWYQLLVKQNHLQLWHYIYSYTAYTGYKANVPHPFYNAQPVCFNQRQCQKWWSYIRDQEQPLKYMLFTLGQGKWLVAGVLVDKQGTAVQAMGVPRPQVVMTTGRVCYGYYYGQVHECRTLAMYNLYHKYGVKYALNNEYIIYIFSNYSTEFMQK